MKHPDFKEEKKLWKQGFKYVAGLDEAGRGPLAGPVTAAAVIINSNFDIRISSLNARDSKQLSQKQREHLYKVLTRHPYVKWGIGVVSEKVIDKINILEATKLAMRRAVKNLPCKPDCLLIDGNFILHPRANAWARQRAIIGADEKVFSCAAASILAKVYRDRLMQKMHKKYPQYGFNKHKGYPTKLHFEMLKKFGPCKIHRKTFEPIKTC